MSLRTGTKSLDDFVPDNRKGDLRSLAPQSRRSRFAKEMRAAEIWRGEYVQQIENLAAMGASPAEIAMCLGVRMSVLEGWVRERYVVQRALTLGTARSTTEVKRALYARAVGYEHPETKLFAHEGVVTDEREVIKHYPPDPTAALVWLRRHEPGQGWGEPGQGGTTVNVNQTTVVDNRHLATMSDDDLLKIVGSSDGLLETSRK